MRKMERDKKQRREFYTIFINEESSRSKQQTEGGSRKEGEEAAKRGRKIERKARSG